MNWLKTDRWSCLFLAAIWFAFFCRTIIGRSVYLLDDLKIIYWPLEYLYASYQNQWQLPLWSNLIGFGHPLLAWGQLGFLNLWHMLLRFFYVPPLTLMQVSVITYFGAGLFGMHLFLRSQRLPQAAATLGAVVFAFNGFHVGHLNHVNFYTITMLLPWLLLSISALARHTTIKRGIIVALIASQMALSGQPQILLYSFAIAALWAIILLFNALHKIKMLAVLALTAVLAISLSSLAIFPLAELIPITDRAAGLPREELYEFSYPPWHIITLIFPYFYGDHSVYWGAKNFQELAAYAGIIPLTLAPLAFYTRRHRPLLVLAVILILSGIALALGQYSPLYIFFVNQEIIKSISVPGRFVYFFTVGLAILSALGLANIAAARRRRLSSIILTLVPFAVICLLFGWQALSDRSSLLRLRQLMSFGRLDFYLISFSLLLVLITIALSSFNLARGKKLLVGFSALTLIVYGWNYNPLLPRAQATTKSPFIEPLLDYAKQTGRSPRLWQTAPPASSQSSRTEAISPRFTVYQPITSSGDSLRCLHLPYSVNEATAGQVKVSIKESMAGSVLRSTSIAADQLKGASVQVCFTPLSTAPNQRLIAVFSSAVDSGFRLIKQPMADPDEQAFFVRIQSPTDEQLASSRKPVRVVISPTTTNQNPTLTLSPHLNVLAKASSANWIGALALKPYRALVTTILADGDYQIDGDGRHVVNKYRHLINLMGITHIVEQKSARASSEYLTQDGFTPIATATEGDIVTTLYNNDSVMPQSFMVKEASFSPADDETIYAMTQPDWQPGKTLFVSGPAPPEQVNLTDELISQAKITRYTDNLVEALVNTSRPAWLVVTDATTPQWSTYVDGQPAPYFAADTIFKTAYVPAGRHTVTFRYQSPAVELAKTLTIIGLVASFVLLVWPARKEIRLLIKSKIQNSNVQPSPKDYGRHSKSMSND